MRRRSHYPDRDQDDDLYGHSEYEHPSFPPHFQERRKRGCANRLGCTVAALLIIGVLTVAILTEVFLPRILMQNYITMKSGIELAQVSVTPELRRHYNTVQITFFDKAGQPTYDSNCNKCIKEGDGVQLEASIINLPWWLKLFWWYAGCKLTLLKSNVTAQHPEVVALNSGDDSSFQTVRSLGGDATHSNFVWIPANGRLYNVFISPNGHLYAELVG